MAFILDPEATSVPYPDRFVSMSITRNADAVVPEPPRRAGHSLRPVLSTDDIIGAKPRALPPHHRADFHDPADIEGARPKPLHFERRNKPDFTTTNTDIEASQPRVNRFQSNRHIDPVNPSYTLPATNERAPSPPPFKRDLHNIDDIAGTKPNVFSRFNTRDHYNVDDIQGTWSRARTREPGLSHTSTLHVKDINDDPGTGPIFKSGRITDPQRPSHIVHGRVVTDDDKGMFVKGPPPWAGTRPFYPLTTEDIEGAKASFQQQVSVGGIPPEKRRTFIVTNFIGDIPGTRVGSKPHGLTSVRMTDPQERDYVLLDGRRWGPDELVVGKSWYNAAATLAAAESSEQTATMPLGKTGIANAIAPAMGYARKILDPRDAEIARLRGEVDTLRKEHEIVALSNRLAATRVASRSVGSAVETPSAAIAGGVGGSRVPTPVTSSAAAAAANNNNNHHHQNNNRSGSNGSTTSEGPNDADVSIAVSRGAARASSGVAASSSGSNTSRLPPSSSSAAATTTTSNFSNTNADPVAALRSTTAAASARNILGVIPATRPQQDMQHTATMRQTGRYDSKLDKYPAVPRGNNSTGSRGGGGGGNNFGYSHETRVAVKEHRAEIDAVKGLPT